MSKRKRLEERVKVLEYAIPRYGRNETDKLWQQNAALRSALELCGTAKDLTLVKHICQEVLKP